MVNVRCAACLRVSCSYLLCPDSRDNLDKRGDGETDSTDKRALRVVASSESILVRLSRNRAGRPAVVHLPPQNLNYTIMQLGISLLTPTKQKYSKSASTTTIGKEKKTMPSKFHKVQKRVNKKKGSTTALHENSRDALRLRSAVARDDRVSRLGALREKINEPHRESLHSLFKNKTKNLLPFVAPTR